MKHRKWDSVGMCVFFDSVDASEKEGQGRSWWESTGAKYPVFWLVGSAQLLAQDLKTKEKGIGNTCQLSDAFPWKPCHFSGIIPWGAAWNYSPFEHCSNWKKKCCVIYMWVCACTDYKVWSY